MRSLLVISALLTLVPPAFSAVPASDLVNAGVKTDIWSDTRPKSRDPELLRVDMVRAHNELRAEFNIAAVVWSDALAQDATAYAQTLADTQRFRHSANTNEDAPQGENLWMGTRTAYAYPDMTDAWIEERKAFRKGVFPEISRTGSWEDVGHFTQMIWADTRAVGCGVASNATDEFLVCRYFPAGNVDGEDPLQSYSTAATSFANASAR